MHQSTPKINVNPPQKLGMLKPGFLANRFSVVENEALNIVYTVCFIEKTLLIKIV